MKLVSWNVNGIRACLDKGFEESFAALDADIFCLQETKCQAGQVSLELPGYAQYWNYAEKKGYSGTAVFSRREPLWGFRLWFNPNGSLGRLFNHSCYNPDDRLG